MDSPSGDGLSEASRVGLELSAHDAALIDSDGDWRSVYSSERRRIAGSEYGLSSEGLVGLFVRGVSSRLECRSHCLCDNSALLRGCSAENEEELAGGNDIAEPVPEPWVGFSRRPRALHAIVAALLAPGPSAGFEDECRGFEGFSPGRLVRKVVRIVCRSGLADLDALLSGVGIEGGDMTDLEGDGTGGARPSVSGTRISPAV